MAKQRRHQSSKPRRKPVQAPKRKSLKAVSVHKLESELYRQVAPGLTTRNRAALKQRMDILAKYKPPEGRTAKVTFDQDTGAAEKTFYTAEGREYDAVKITPEGKISMGAIEWIVEEQSAAGLVNICGTMNVPFAVQAQECVPEDHPLYDCIPEENKSLLCCLDGLIVREGDIGCEFGDPPGCTPKASSLTYDPVSGHFIGDYPLTGFDVPADAKLHVWCSGGWNVALYHGATHQTDLTFTDGGGGINLFVEWGADPYTCCGGAETGGFTIEGDFGG